MRHTLGTAARATGLSKSTIHLAIKARRISVGRNDIGEYEIDPSELHRVFPPVSTAKAVVQSGAIPSGAVDLALKNARLEAEIAASTLVAELLRRQLDETRRDLDHWRGQAQRLALPPPVSTTQVIHAMPVRGGFVARLFGRA